jgi:hypothetical protein
MRQSVGSEEIKVTGSGLWACVAEEASWAFGLIYQFF